MKVVFIYQSCYPVIEVWYVVQQKVYIMEYILLLWPLHQNNSDIFNYIDQINSNDDNHD
jgi:hypothetical protein